MTIIELPFVFSAENGSPAAEDFILRLPEGIQDTASLFSSYMKAGRFPSYFGNNWDALNDCLRDFSWISQKKIHIIHNDLPLSCSENELLTYLEILAAAVKLWKQQEQHELLVLFPLGVKTTVIRLLSPK